jgi:hypothetical protein
MRPKRMGHPLVREDNSRSPSGMTSKKGKCNYQVKSNGNSNPPFSMKPKRMGHPDSRR